MSGVTAVVRVKNKNNPVHFDIFCKIKRESASARYYLINNSPLEITTLPITTFVCSIEFCGSAT
jgi:hypothetical protein